MAESLQASRVHDFHLCEFRHAPDVDCAPGAGRFSRSEPDGVAGLVKALTNPINPAKTKSAIYRLGPGQAGSAATLLVKANSKLLGVGIVLLQPVAKFRWKSKELRLGRHDGTER